MISLCKIGGKKLATVVGATADPPKATSGFTSTNDCVELQNLVPEVCRYCRVRGTLWSTCLAPARLTRRLTVGWLLPTGGVFTTASCWVPDVTLM